MQIDKKYAILIGIDNYFDDIIRPLKYSVADIQSFYEVITDPNRGGYKLENVRLFSDVASRPDLKPTRSNIMSQVSSLASMTTTNDNLLVYFSGHGIEKNRKCYLVPQDARYNVLNESAIGIKWIKNVLMSSNARTKILILDACHSGAIKGKSASGYMTKGFQKEIFPPPEGFSILSSCKMSEVSWEDDNMKHGVFSYFFVDGLKGAADYDKDSKITMMEASKYTFEKVSSWALSNSRTQSPTLECAIFGDVVLCQVPPDYVPPSPVEMAVTKLRLGSQTFEKIKSDEIIGKLCGVLINFIEPETLSMESEDEVAFSEGKIVRAETSDKTQYYIDIFFDYCTENQETIDQIITRLDNSEILKFDEIEFFLATSIDINYVAKKYREKGFNIISFNLASKTVQIELPSELRKEATRLTIKDTGEHLSILLKNVEDFFKPDFYDRINPRSIMEISAIVQER